VLAFFLTWYRRLACSYFLLLEEQARRLYHTLLIKNACVQSLSNTGFPSYLTDLPTEEGNIKQQA
jgi:hypothetical protein